ncbi:hypothetical protein N431DRAFT_102647 [Stipitochalara longipes BDJ]|nr:hypothetical protein N431DRAFT_102647 [Stipitochalara longipes BDJ]
MLILVHSHSLALPIFTDASLSLPTPSRPDAGRGGSTIELVKKLVARPDPSLSHKCKARPSFFFPRAHAIH